MQIAGFVSLRTGVATTDLYAHLLVANLYQVVHDFAQEGFADYVAAYAIGVIGIGKADFGRTASQIEHFLGLHALGHDETAGQLMLGALNIGILALPDNIGEAGNADEAENELVLGVVINVQGGVDLLHYAELHNQNAVGKGHSLGLVMGYVNNGEAIFAL